MFTLAKSPVAEVKVLPKPGGSAARGNLWGILWGNLWSAARVEADAGALVWPQLCCCCGSATDLNSIVVYSIQRFGNKCAAIHIPYCRRCKSHYRQPAARALESAVWVFAIGFTIAFLVFLLEVLNDGFGLGAFLLQVLVVFGSIVWAARTYFVARGEIKSGVTPACSVAQTAAVIFLTAEPSAWRFRFYSRAYAEQFAAVNPGGYLTPLYLD